MKDKHDIVSLENFKNWRAQVDGYWTKKTHIEETRGTVIDEMLQIDEKFKRHLKSSEAEAIQETNKNLADIADSIFPHPKFQIREKDRIKNLAIVKDRMWPIKKMKGSLVKTGEALYQLNRDYLSGPRKNFARRSAITKISEGLDLGSQIENVNLPSEPTGDHQDLSPSDTAQPDPSPTKRTRTFFFDKVIDCKVRVSGVRKEEKLFSRLAQMRPIDHLENLKSIGSDMELRTELALARHGSVGARREGPPGSGKDRQVWNEKQGNFMETQKSRERMKVLDPFKEMRHNLKGKPRRNSSFYLSRCKWKPGWN